MWYCADWWNRGFYTELYTLPLSSRAFNLTTIPVVLCWLVECLVVWAWFNTEMIVVSCSWYILSSVNIHNYVIWRFCSDQSFTAFPCFSLREKYGGKVLLFWSTPKRERKNSDQSFTAFPCFSLWEKYGGKVLLFWSTPKRENLIWSVFHCISMLSLARKVWQQSPDGFLINPPQKENLGWLLAWNSFMVMLVKNIGFCSARSSEGNLKHFQLCVWICFAVMWLVQPGGQDHFHWTLLGEAAGWTFQVQQLSVSLPSLISRWWTQRLGFWVRWNMGGPVHCRCVLVNETHRSGKTKFCRNSNATNS